MSEQRPSNPLLGWLIVGVIAYLLWQHFQDAPQPHDPDDPNPPVVTEGIWDAVAMLVEEGDPEDSQELCALVIQLKEVNLLTQAQVDDFNDAFPGICETDRDLTDADAEKLRGLE